MNTTRIDILLAEDNPFEAKLAIKALANKNLTANLHHVKDGAETLDFIFAREAYSYRQSERFPRLILLDLKMPRFTGLEVLRHLKENEETRAIPVVILTSSDQEKDIVEAFALGANSYIVKPVDYGNFTKTVTDVGLYWVFLNQTPASIG